MTANHLPSPPSDQELYWYFGPQRRWVPLLSALAFTLSAGTMLSFSLRTPALWPFLAVLGVNAVALALTCLNGLRRRRFTRGGHELLVAAWQPAEPPSVDLYLPTCGEPLDILANAYRAVARNDYPGQLDVWVLDDADRPEVAGLAQEFGYHYVVRPNRGEFKKAGNLNHALTLSRGEYVAILDADFAPRADLLQHLLPYFGDPKVGIVQSPQCFDTDASMGWVQRAAGSAQEWFFRWVQPSRDASDAAICCGSNAVYRRAAIDAAGGFARLDHSEDMYTGLALHQKGYTTRYVPVLVAKGTSPDSTTSFVNQQYRWTMGNLHLIGDRATRKAMTWRMRRCFDEGIVGYLAAAVNVLTAPLPPLVMLFAFPGEVRAWYVLPMLSLLWLWHVLLPRVSRTRWRSEVLRANVLMSFAAATAYWHTARGRSAAWVPTGVAKPGRSGGMARKVLLVSLLWTAGTLLATGIGVAAATWLHGWNTTWGLALYLAVQLHLGVPLIRDLYAELRPRATESAEPTASADSGAHPAMRPRRWPEALAVTSTLALIALLASGWAAPMLPWLG
ncbi:cellulose synthase catalytic subunit [Kitasatospora sp. YST-16]|uniref:glycosyltransferase family 2 protein n=1 Tax=Kitasatospora sp. YST-16 TaxID=2998080 RepID=UPI00228528C4|nr:cellulose synthase catalytic subunit [Kitasatospora sp. YST-16]WAL70922.1 cellulose synthase catalytic subunit [Kitasatospora sp. YST-16]WNW36959.1 cellulose synthase catalytic subunit [Streptomyces sp. Li-HN-5-13]